MDSASYMLTNEDVITHLKAVAGILNPGGIYILEMNHPKDIFRVSTTTVNSWEMAKDGIQVKLQWGAKEDVFDPISQITHVSVRLEYVDGEKRGVSEDRSPQRCFTATELAALVAASGVFEIVDWYGAMDLSIPFDNDKKAWRMVPVLKKI